MTMSWWVLSTSPLGLAEVMAKGPVMSMRCTRTVRSGTRIMMLSWVPTLLYPAPTPARTGRMLAGAQLLLWHQGGSPAAFGSDPAPCTQLNVPLWMSIPGQKAVRAEEQFGVQLGKKEIIHYWRYHSHFHGRRTQ